MSPRPDSPRLYGLIQAAADGDAVAEERGVEAALNDLGISLEDARYIAEQRALRAVAIFAGRGDEIAQSVREKKFQPVELTAEQREQMKVLTAAYLDGIALGARWAQRRASDFGIGRDAIRP